MRVAVRADGRHGRAPQGPADDRRRGRAPPLAQHARPRSSSSSGRRAGASVGGLDRPFVRVLGAQPGRSSTRCYRRARACCLASRLRGLRPPRRWKRSHAAAPSRSREGSALAEVVGDAGAALPGRRRRGVHRRARTPPRRRRRCTTSSPVAGPRRAAELTWAHSAEAHSRRLRTRGRAAGPARA